MLLTCHSASLTLYNCFFIDVQHSVTCLKQIKTLECYFAKKCTITYSEKMQYFHNNIEFLESLTTQGMHHITAICDHVHELTILANILFQSMPIQVMHYATAKICCPTLLASWTSSEVG
jgi:hypothetical protein